MPSSKQATQYDLAKMMQDAYNSPASNNEVHSRQSLLVRENLGLTPDATQLPRDITIPEDLLPMCASIGLFASQHSRDLGVMVSAYVFRAIAVTCAYNQANAITGQLTIPDPPSGSTDKEK